MPLLASPPPPLAPAVTAAQTAMPSMPIAGPVPSGTLAVPFAQEPECQGAPRTQFVRRTWWYTEERVPFMRGVLRVGHVVAVSWDQDAGDAAMLLGVSYDDSTRRLTVRGVSGDVTAVVERLDVTAELHPDDVALYVRRRRSHLLGAESDVPLWDERAV